MFIKIQNDWVNLDHVIHIYVESYDWGHNIVFKSSVPDYAPSFGYKTEEERDDVMLTISEMLERL
jgi:hypothetical protein